MKPVSCESALTLCFAFSGMVQSVAADDRAPARPAGTVPAARKSTAQSVATPARLAAKPNQPPVRQVQLDSHGRYPYGQFLGGYRYPFQYPFYRNRPRHYPFGVGPYGPYGSNYGGYSGNAYDPGVYGSPVPNAPDAPPPVQPPGAPLIPPPDDAARGPAAGPPAVMQPGASNVARGDQMLDSGVQARLTPAVVGPAYGDPGQFPGGSPFNPGYGAAQTFRAYPFGYYGDQMWFGQDHLVYGFGMYPIPNYSYFAGPPAGFNVSGPEIFPQYFNYAPRNFGPYNPGIGGLNGNSGLMQGW